MSDSIEVDESTIIVHEIEAKFPDFFDPTTQSSFCEMLHIFMQSEAGNELSDIATNVKRIVEDYQQMRYDLNDIAAATQMIADELKLIASK
jgi:hypothetical protein